MRFYLISSVIFLFMAFKGFTAPGIYQLNYSGTGSHLLNLYISQLLQTDVNIISHEYSGPYKKFNELFHLEHNPSYPTFYRTHFLTKIPKNEEAESILIVLVRDFKESFFHQVNNKQISASLKEALAKFPNNMREYFEILRFYEDWQGEKILLYYEDLLENPEIACKSLGKIFSLPVDQVSVACDKGKRLKHRIFSIYPGNANSKGKDTQYHSSKHSQKVIEEMNSKVKIRYPEISKKYLKRYF